MDRELLIQSLTESAIAYREMSDGNPNLGGFCLAMSNRLSNMIIRLNDPMPTESEPVQANGNAEALTR